MTYAEVVSTIALASSLLGLWLHWTRYRREKADLEPEVTTKRAIARGLPGWSVVEITVRNRANLSLTVNHLTVIWPLSGKIGTLRAGTAVSKEAFREPLHPPTDRARSINPNMMVAHAGTTPKRMEITGFLLSHGDAHSASFLVSASPSASLRLRISASWSLRSLRPWSNIISVETISATPTKITQ